MFGFIFGVASDLIREVAYAAMGAACAFAINYVTSFFQWENKNESLENLLNGMVSTLLKNDLIWSGDILLV